MDGGDEYEEETVPYEIGGYQEKVEHDGHSSSSSHVDHGNDSDDPPILSPPHHTMDIPSVPRPPVPGMLPADRVSTNDLPLVETLTVVEGELFHNYIPQWC